MPWRGGTGYSRFGGVNPMVDPRMSQMMMQPPMGRGYSSYDPYNPMVPPVIAGNRPPPFEMMDYDEDMYLDPYEDYEQMMGMGMGMGMGMPGMMGGMGYGYPNQMDMMEDQWDWV